MPLRAACSVRSFLLVEDILKTDTLEPSSLNVPRACTHPLPQASSKVSSMVYGNAVLLLTRAVSLANILLSCPVQALFEVIPPVHWGTYITRICTVGDLVSARCDGVKG